MLTSDMNFRRILWTSSSNRSSNS